MTAKVQLERKKIQRSKFISVVEDFEDLFLEVFLWQIRTKSDPLEINNRNIVPGK